MSFQRVGTDRKVTTVVGSKFSVTITTDPTLLLGANPERLDFLINNTSSVTITIGYNDTDIVEPVPAGATYTTDTYFGPIYATVNSGTADVIVTEHA